MPKLTPDTERRIHEGFANKRISPVRRNANGTWHRLLTDTAHTHPKTYWAPLASNDNEAAVFAQIHTSKQGSNTFPPSTSRITNNDRTLIRAGFRAQGYQHVRRASNGAWEGLDTYHPQLKERIHYQVIAESDAAAIVDLDIHLS